MGMTLLQACVAYAHKMSFLHIFDIRGAAISHSRAQPSHELEHRIRDRPSIGHPPFNPLGDQFLLIALEIAVLATSPHRANGTHAAIHFVTASLINFQRAWTLICSRQKATYHNAISTSSNRLGHIAGVFYSPVGDDGDPCSLGSLHTIHYRRHLGHPYSGNNPSGANRPRSNAHLNCIYTGLN